MLKPDAWVCVGVGGTLVSVGGAVAVGAVGVIEGGTNTTVGLGVALGGVGVGVAV